MSNPVQVTEQEFNDELEKYSSTLMNYYPTWDLYEYTCLKTGKYIGEVRAGVFYLDRQKGPTCSTAEPYNFDLD